MDREAITGIAVIIGFVVIFGAIVFFSIRAERRMQAALRELAEARGWSFETHSTRGFGRRAARKGFTLSPAGAGGDWKLDVTRRSSSSGVSVGVSGKRGRSRSRSRNRTRSTNPGRAEFRAPEPTFRGGLAVFTTGATGAAMGAGQGGLADSVMGIFDNKLGKTVLSHLMGADMGEYAGQLKSWPTPEGSGITVMATADPSLFFDMEAIGAALGNWKPAKGFFNSSPQLIIGEAGVRLFLNQQITDADSIARFIDLGQELREKAMRGG